MRDRVLVAWGTGSVGGFPHSCRGGQPRRETAMARPHAGPKAPTTAVRDSALGNGPRLPRVFISRHRLWEQLDRATESALTLLVAPGGAGKTLGVGGWVTLNTVAPANRGTWIQGDDPSAEQDLRRLISADEPDAASATGPWPPLVIVDDAHAL